MSEAGRKKLKVITIFPFHLFDGFIFIDGEVNGTQGKFILDTGTPFNFLLNNNFIKLPKNDFYSSGLTTSGQKITIYSADSISNLRIYNNNIGNELKGIKHADLQFIGESITPDFIGFIGAEFIQEFGVLMDFDYQTITIYQESIDLGLDEYIKIKMQGDISKPMFEIYVGGERIAAYIDTGCPGTLVLKEEMKTKLVKLGVLNISSTPYMYGEPGEYLVANLNYVSLDSKTVLKPLRYLDFSVGNENIIGLGYQLFKNYKAFLMLDDKTLYLKER
ncbi:hypothetical protein ACWKXN_19975 [Enterobacter sp. UPMP2060]